MKKSLFSFIAVAVFLSATIPAQAGVFKNGVKPAAKVVSFPFVHPKKFFRGVGHGSKKAAVVMKKVAD